jgi:hypothetical protein
MKKRIIDTKKPTKEQIEKWWFDKLPYDNSGSLTLEIINNTYTQEYIKILNEELDWRVLIKYKKVNKKQFLYITKDTSQMLTSELISGIKKFKFNFKEIKKLIETNSDMLYILPQIIKYNKLNQRQILKLEKHNTDGPTTKKLSYKSKHQLNLNKPKHYSRKIYINLLAGEMKNK